VNPEAAQLSAHHVVLLLAAVLVLLTIPGAAQCGEDAKAAPARANLILISIDTLRADHVGAYGYGRPTTPAIDRFAKDSVLFETCIAHAPTTLASHGSILTSLLPIHHGASIARKSSLAKGVKTLAEVLRDGQYRTASFNGGIQLDAIYGLDRGFDRYVSAQPDDARASVLAGDENRMQVGVDRALSWLGESDEPFFLFLHSYEIHHPYTPDEKILDTVADPYTGDLGNVIEVSLLEAVNRQQKSLGPGDLEHIIGAYDAELRSVDNALKVFFAELELRGLYDRTMIVITSDHGEEFGEHGSVGWHSHTLFDELLRVPLIVKYPESRHAGMVVETQVRGIDLAPTVLSALGLPIPAAFAGEALDLEIAGVYDRPLPAISMFDQVDFRPWWSIRAEGWKAVTRKRSQLFDLRRDPGELIDSAGEHADRTERMTKWGSEIMGATPRPLAIPIQPRDETTDQLRALGYLE
jgi:arylsulfatase A-like enzyme